MTKKKPPKIPTNTELANGVSQDEFLLVLDNISKRLCHKFKFAYHNIDDMKQQAAIFALEGLKKYDNKRPLENFLWTHVRNRLFNYKRNNYQRPDKPCLTCPLFDKNFKCSLNQCSKYTNKSDCDLYRTWSKRNDSKKNIIQPSYIEEDLHPTKSKDLANFIQDKEIIQFLDSNIQSEYRESYLKLKHGTKIPKQQLDKLKKHISELMENKLWKTKNYLHENEDN
jgi:DNA-directed RNA polymerase specialized sigma24 family protein